MEVASRIQQIEKELKNLNAQKQQEILRIEKEIKKLETELKNLKSQKQKEREQSGSGESLDPPWYRRRQSRWPWGSGESLDPKVTEQLSSLCDRINRYIEENYESTSPHVIRSGLRFVAISHALQMYNNTEEIVKNNLKAIANFMCGSIHSGTVKIRSYELKGYGHFDIHLTLQDGAKDLRIFSGLSGRAHDPDFDITIQLT